MNCIQLRAPLSLRVTAPDTLPSRFEGIAYTGGIVASYGVVIDLATTRVTEPMPLLSEHDRQGIIGAVSQAAVKGGQIVVSGKLFSDIPGGQAERIAQLAQRGAPFQLSVGLFGFSEEVVYAGQVVTVNGATFAGPATVLRRGTVREVSVVTLGADPKTTVQMFASGRQHSNLNPRSVFARRAREAAGGGRL